MKIKIIQLGVAALMLTVPSVAQQIIDTSGITGSITGVAQSYNESRAIEVKVLTPYNINLTKMTLYHFNVGNGNTIATVNARIFSTTTHALLYSHDSTINAVYQGTIQIPVSFALQADSTYRIGFYCGSPTNNGNSANMWQPTSFPYTESQGILRIITLCDISSDTYPSLSGGIFAPVMSFNYDTASITNGINTINLRQQINVFPNPVTDNLNVQVDNYEPSEIILYDILSRKLLRQTFTNTITIKTEQLVKGMYLYEVRNKNGVIKKGKVVKD